MHIISSTISLEFMGFHQSTVLLLVVQVDSINVEGIAGVWRCVHF